MIKKIKIKKKIKEQKVYFGIKWEKKLKIYYIINS
jgi:hypothetical protein